MVKVEDIILAIQKSDLDPVIKDILIRDVRSFGVNDFIKEQILAYCDKAEEILKDKIS